MKRFATLISVFVILTAMTSCGKKGWRGFENEDLSEYLTLADYSGLTYTLEEVSVSDSEIDGRLNLMLDAAAVLTETDKEFAYSMTVAFNAYCFIDGVSEPSYSIEGGAYIYDEEKYENEVVNLLLPEMVGMKKGEVKKISVTFSNGVFAEFRTTVTAVYEMTVPALNDTTAEIILPGSQTVDGLRAKIRAILENEKLEKNKRALVSDLKNQIIDGSTVISIPYSVYNGYYEDRLSLYKNLAEQMGMTLNAYVEFGTGLTMSEFESMLSEGAMADVKEALVLYSIVKRENITSTEDGIKEYCERMATESGGMFASGEEYMSYYGENAVKNEFLWDEVMEIVLERANGV